MLLPSAFPCDGALLSSRIFEASSALTYPSSSLRSRHQRAISSDIYTTCRTLQGRLSSNISQSPSQTLCAPTLLPSPTLHPTIEASHTKHAGLNSSIKSRHAESAPRRKSQGPSRGAKKRRRSISDDETRDSVSEINVNDAPSTPKRQRIAPPSLPLGLLSQDFDDLSRTPATDDKLSSRPANSPATLHPDAQSRAQPYAQSTALSSPTYSSALVSLIMEKFSLRETAWKDLQSTPGDLDDRWRSLMAIAEMARGRKLRREMVIRRGGRRERKSLEGIW